MPTDMAGNTYFISDLHLGAHYLEHPRENELRVVRFLDHIGSEQARALYLLGDILDYWYEYRHVVPRGHVRFLGKLAQLADAGVQITWLTGNHDVWLFDYLRDEVGLTVLREHTVVDVGDGHHFMISHGDDVGYQPPMYRFMRWCFYNRACQWLYAAIHPRWTYPIATSWSTNNRTKRKPDVQQQCVERSAQNLIAYSRQFATTHPEVEAYLYGHLHLARQVPLADGDSRQVVFLGDWITQCTYAVWDGESLKLKAFE